MTPRYFDGDTEFVDVMNCDASRVCQFSCQRTRASRLMQRGDGERSARSMERCLAHLSDKDTDEGEELQEWELEEEKEV